MLKPGTSGPRAMVGLCRDGRSRTFAVHVLVARAFLGPCPDGQEVCHGPAGRRDNRLVNLSYGTPSKNNGEDKRRDGTLPVGVLNPRAILTEEIVRECRIRVAAGESRSALAREFDVSDTVIRKAVAGIAWRHVVQPPPLPPVSKSRPAQAGEMPVVTARWEASLLRAARLHAENKGLTLSDVVRQAVTDYLEKNSDDPNPLSGAGGCVTPVRAAEPSPQP